MKSMLNILYLEDQANDVELVRTLISAHQINCEITQVETRPEFLAALEEDRFDLIFADYALPSFDGMSALALAHQKRPDIPFIILSGTLGEELAIECLKNGATDYVLKQRMYRLIPSMQRALNEAEEKRKREQAEEALAIKAEELARSNAELEQFAYMASHDLQEPLRMVNSYVQLLEKRYKHKLDSDANEFIAFVVEGATRMKSLIDNMLSFSRLGAEDEPHLPIDCNIVLSDVLDNLKFIIDENKAIISADPLPEVSGNSTHLTELFQNLISNAIKFRSKDPPKIHVSARAVSDMSISKSQENSKFQIPNPKSKGWLFSVRDNGIGIEPEYHERIFQIFKRLHSRSEYSGTGIGLAICKKIITQNGGRIWVESEPGKGSTFYFTIPFTENKEQRSFIKRKEESTIKNE